MIFLPSRAISSQQWQEMVSKDQMELVRTEELILFEVFMQRQCKAIRDCGEKGRGLRILPYSLPRQVDEGYWKIIRYHVRWLEDIGK